MSTPPLRLAPARRAFILPDGRAVLLVAGRTAPLLLSGPGLADLLDVAAADGLEDKHIAAAASSGAAATIRRLLDGGHLARIAHSPPPTLLPPGVIDARRGSRPVLLDCGDGDRHDPLVLLVADYAQAALRQWADHAWQAGRALLPVAVRPDSVLAGPLAPPGLPCLDCTLRRQSGLRPVESALWAGVGGTRPLPFSLEDPAVLPAFLASIVQAMRGRPGPPALRLVTASTETWHPIHPGPGCHACPSQPPQPPDAPSSPRALLDALAPWISPEAGLASLLPSPDHNAPIQVELAHEALRQQTDDLAWALTRGTSASTGKSTDRHEAKLGAIAEAIERGALLTPLPEADSRLPQAGPPSDSFVVAYSLHDGTLWRVARATVQLARQTGTDADLWFEPCGTAFGRNEADAIDRALQERLERDAVLRWWSRRALLPLLRLNSEVTALVEQVAGQLGTHRRPPWLLDATTEIGLPVAIAVSMQADSYLPILGFGAGWSTTKAANAALHELVAQQHRLAASSTLTRKGSAFWDFASAPPKEHTFLSPITRIAADSRPDTNRAEVLRALLMRAVHPMAVVHATLWPSGPCVARVVASGLEGLAQNGQVAGADPPPYAPGWNPGPYPANAMNPWAFPG